MTLTYGADSGDVDKGTSVKFPTARFVLTLSNVHPLGTLRCEKKTPKTFER